MPWLDEDHDRFVNGDPGPLSPAPWVLFIIGAVIFLNWLIN